MLKEFIHHFDKNHGIVLLEGKRNIKESDKNKLIQLGELLATKTEHVTFRSGNSSGADYFFSVGVASVDKKRLQVITPYSGHRQKANLAYQNFALDDIDIANEPEVIFYSKQNKKTEKLIDRYVSGDNNRNSIKAAYIIRDTIKAIGCKNIKPATFGIFYDDLASPREGGTGHTMNICEQKNIPIIDQQVWFNWLTE